MFIFLPVILSTYWFKRIIMSTSRNYLILGHATGIGAALTHQLASKENIGLWGTYHQTTPVDQPAGISSHHLNVLDEQPDFSFLPDTLHGLAYCVGAIQLKPFHRTTANDYIHDYQLQVLGAIKTIQACLPALKNSGQASIVLFSTVAVQTGFTFHSVVSASKGALEGLTRALSAELAPHIRLNCIAPSLTRTPLAASLLSTPEKEAAMAAKNPLKRVGEAQDIAATAAFLLSPESSWMTGQVIHVDGGMGAIRI